MPDKESLTDTHELRHTELPKQMEDKRRELHDDNPERDGTVEKKNFITASDVEDDEASEDEE